MFISYALHYYSSNRNNSLVSCCAHGQKNYLLETFLITRSVVSTSVPLAHHQGGSFSLALSTP